MQIINSPAPLNITHECRKTYTSLTPSATNVFYPVAYIDDYAGHAHLRLQIDWTISTTTGQSMIIDYTWTGVYGQMQVLNSEQTTKYVRYPYIWTPNNASYYASYKPCAVIRFNNTTAGVMTVTVLECDHHVTFPDTLETKAATNYNSENVDINSYRAYLTNTYVNGDLSGTAGTSNNAWDTIIHDRYNLKQVMWYHGSTAYAQIGSRLFGVGSDGYYYLVARPDQTFDLPFNGGRAYYNRTVANSYGNAQKSIRGLNLSEFTTQYYANTANLTAGTTYSGIGTVYGYKYVVRTHTSSTAWTDATTLVIGKPIFICGTLSDGTFKPYYTKASAQTCSIPSGQAGFTSATNVVCDVYTFYLTQTPAYTANYDTYLYIGKADMTTTSLSIDTEKSIAYTFDRNGRLTAVDGCVIANSGRAGGVVTATMDGYAQFRAVGGNYGYMIRNDGSNVYGLMTASGSQYGTWTSARPWTINCGTGVMNINGTAAGNLTSSSTLDATKLSGTIPSSCYTNTTYSVATTSANGLMSSTDKTKLDGIATGANAYVHPSDGGNTGSFGPSANASPAHGGTFSVPYITVNSAGHVTAASTKTITLPASGDTDIKVRQTVLSGSDTVYRSLILAAGPNTQSGNIDDITYRSAKIYANDKTGSLYATNLYSGSSKVITSSDSRLPTSSTDYSSSQTVTSPVKFRGSLGSGSSTSRQSIFSLSYSEATTYNWINFKCTANSNTATDLHGWFRIPMKGLIEMTVSTSAAYGHFGGVISGSDYTRWAGLFLYSTSGSGSSITYTIYTATYRCYVREVILSIV